ncbi:DUF1080 domain-containing protein [Aureibaculum algae]|uniref:DUF1080 domain-containing protein n=1 Tax=Aureibaculum algae TaxID=2584122 RepID=A0A5B7TY75_9FLAO|nr:DUF1080 domain-containing protein [Aureibaculum algae]QCX40333.1 DUF1080 domain-containing protein [Aureibaculum algae]
MKKPRIHLKKTSLLIALLFLLKGVSITAQNKDWKPLLDKNLSQWELFIGVPHTSIEKLDDAPKGDGMKGTPLGLNNDPLKVFSTENIDGETILHISGEIYGALTSKKIYENYHLKLQFKWGEKKWEPRLNLQRDNGILYHCIGEHGAFWNVWKQSQEFQIQEKDMGDYYGLAGGVNNIHATKLESGFYQYDPKGKIVLLGDGQGDKMYRCIRSENFEKPHGEWNTLELICFNGKSYHFVNGHVVLILDQAQSKTEDGFTPVTKGQIQLQSEGAEAFYKNISIKELKKLPKNI